MKAIYIIIIPLFVIKISFANVTLWQKLEPGLEYTTIQHTVGFPHGAIHAFKINLKQFRLDLALTYNKLRPLTTVKDLVEKNNAVIGINGGFFSPNLEPLGLRINNGKKLSALKGTSWWSIFYIKYNKAYIVSRRIYRRSQQIQFAVQSGPRLVIKGRIPKLKPGFAKRSAICITRIGKVVIIATEHLFINPQKFAQILNRPQNQGGLGCYNALNLDGGSSTQLFARINNFKLNIPSYAPVADAILVMKK